MIGYLLAHMYGNLKVFAGQAAFDDYAHHLRTLGEPILPYTGLLWIIRVVLLVASSPTSYAAVALWRAGPQGPRRDAGATTAARPRRGVQRTLRVVHAALGRRRHRAVRDLPPAAPDLEHRSTPAAPPTSPYERVVNGFQIWWVVLAYTIAMIAVGFHLRHGIWSALTTLGANTSAVARRRLNLLAYVVARRHHGRLPAPPVRDPLRIGEVMS